MKNNNLLPDIVCFTTLIQEYHKARNLKKCWEIYNKISTEMDVDESIISYMIRLASYTHDSEKALNLGN